jgi:hypothetical protein
VEVAFEISDRLIAATPDLIEILSGIVRNLVIEQLGMNADHQDRFVAAAIQNTDPPAFRKIARCAPEAAAAFAQYEIVSHQTASMRHSVGLPELMGKASAIVNAGQSGNGIGRHKRLGNNPIARSSTRGRLPRRSQGIP